MFLILKKFEPQRSYKHGSYSTKSVQVMVEKLIPDLGGDSAFYIIAQLKREKSALIVTKL